MLRRHMLLGITCYALVATAGEAISRFAGWRSDGDDKVLRARQIDLVNELGDVMLTLRAERTGGGVLIWSRRDGEERSSVPSVYLGNDRFGASELSPRGVREPSLRGAEVNVSVSGWPEFGAMSFFDGKGDMAIDVGMTRSDATHPIAVYGKDGAQQILQIPIQGK